MTTQSTTGQTMTPTVERTVGFPGGGGGDESNNLIDDTTNNLVDDVGNQLTD